MVQPESIADVLVEKTKKPLLEFMKIVDPERKFAFDDFLIKAWNALSLIEKRKLYLYVLYKKWRGEEFYGTPYDIITNCHPYPTNWNGRTCVNTLMKSSTKMVIALFNGSYGTYTLDEAKLWEMTIKQPLNF